MRRPGLDPTVERDLALGLVGTRERRAEKETEFRRMARAADEERLLRVLAGERVASVAGGRLLEIAPDAVSPAFAAAVAKAGSEARARAVLHEHVALSAVGVLEEGGIAAVPLKGPLLGRRLHGDPGLRSASCDVDVLVRRADLERAVRLLGALGYTCPEHVAWEAGLPLLHYTLVPADASFPPLDLHWRTHWHGDALADELVERSFRDPVCGRRLPPELELATALLFYARDSFTGLRLLADVACCWDACGDRIPPGSLDDLIERHPALGRPLLAAAAVAERLVGLPAGTLVTGAPRMSRRERLACRLAGCTDDAESAAERRDRAVFVEWLLTPPACQGAFMRRNMFQPAAVFADAHGLDSGTGTGARLLRAAHGSVRTLRWSLRFVRTALRASHPGEGVA